MKYFHRLFIFISLAFVCFMANGWLKSEMSLTIIEMSEVVCDLLDASPPPSGFR